VNPGYTRGFDLSGPAVAEVGVGSRPNVAGLRHPASTTTLSRSVEAENLGDGFGRVLGDLDHPPLNLARVRVILEMLDTNAR
jgi:hypothetical protein